MCIMREFALHSVDYLFFAGESPGSLQGKEESCLVCLCLAQSPPLPPSRREFPFCSWDLQPARILPAEKEVHILCGLWPEYAASAILLSRRGEELERDTFRPDFEISGRIYDLIVKRSLPSRLFELVESP